MLGLDAKSNPEGFIQGFNDNPFHRYLGWRLLNNAQITGACVYSATIRPPRVSVAASMVALSRL